MTTIEVRSRRGKPITVRLTAGEKHKIVVQSAPPSSRFMLDGFFHTESALLLPSRPAVGGTLKLPAGAAGEPQPYEDEFGLGPEALARVLGDHIERAQGTSQPRRETTALVALAATLWLLEGDPELDLLIAGHSSAPGSRTFNEKLSESRAKVVRALLEGDRDAFVQEIDDNAAGEDDAVMLTFAVQTLGLRCEPGSIRPTVGKEPVWFFQEGYNHVFGASIHEDGIVGEQTRGAYFDVLQRDLARRVGGEERLAELREHLRFHPSAEPVLACGEDVPTHVSAPQFGRPVDARRVELLFIDPSSEVEHVTIPEDVYQPRLPITDLEFTEIVGPDDGASPEEKELEFVEQPPVPLAESVLARERIECAPPTYQRVDDDPFHFRDPLSTTHGGSHLEGLQEE